ncbi:olfactory receptor family 13 subfamily C member 8 [Phyllostomus discolor]|uniref:Olfactory receptor n=1 Tax=Phyllostomus discolor TaxID=89673 RepID=A0A6J2MGI1_9CHIR|nr:olfactory receptor 13C8 [Phyllostomus discolor]KAF6126201.1 olfactory receptor family 13 subfamily C member 8 [Phyllostomus discolor]
MGRTNDSIVTEFVLVGLSSHPKLQTVFFVIVLWMYLMTLLGNGVLISVIIYDSHLHTPMYFFLCNLSFLDICYTSSSVPLILNTFLTVRNSVPFSGCMVQMFLSFAMGATECVLLGMMALDRYVAICYPLRYPVIMSKGVYMLMAAGSWVSGLVNSVVQTSLAIQLPFCANNVINHFFCEILAILKLACADISVNVISMTVSNLMFLVIPLLVISISYTFIVATILRIPSTEGKRKAFSTCSAHLTVVTIFYGTVFFMYSKPKSSRSVGTDNQDIIEALISLFYGVVTPTLNPLIYSLRNKDVKAAVKNLLGRKNFSDGT